MKIFRFMCELEFREYMNGKTLTNTTQHDADTNSIGFCFLKLDDFKPEDAIHFLSGIVDWGVCAVFEVDEKKLSKSYGVYADHSNDSNNEDINTFMFLMQLATGMIPRFKATEYCVTQYDKKAFKLIKYCNTAPDMLTEKKWKWKYEI